MTFFFFPFESQLLFQTLTIPEVLPKETRVPEYSNNTEYIAAPEGEKKKHSVFWTSPCI